MAQPDNNLDIADDLREARTAVKRASRELDTANRALARVEEKNAARVAAEHGIALDKETT